MGGGTPVQAKFLAVCCERAGGICLISTKIKESSGNRHEVYFCVKNALVVFSGFSAWFHETNTLGVYTKTMLKESM